MINLYSLFTKALYTLGAGIIIMQLQGNDSIVSLLFYLTFVINVIFWCSFEFKNLDRQGLLAILIVVVAFLCVLVNSALENGPISFGYLKKIIMFSMTIFFFRISSKLKISNDDLIYIQRLISLITIILIIFYFARPEEMHMFNGYVTSYLTFKFQNPNLTGMFLACFCMLEFMFLIQSKKTNLKVFHGLLFLSLLFFIIQTKARNSILALIAFLIFYIWSFWRKKTEFRFNKILSLIVAVFPIIFALLYIQIVNSNTLLPLFSFIVSKGKELDSREQIWMSALDYIKENPIFGAYCQISEGTGSFQLHNTHIDILASYGVIVFFLVCVFLMRLIHNNNKTYRDKSSFLCMLGFASTIFLGLGEAAVFSGGLAIYMWCGLFLILRNRLFKE